MNNASTITRHFFKSTLVLFIIFTIVTVSFFSASAQETQDENTSPYVMGEIFIQYDETTYRARMNELERVARDTPGSSTLREPVGTVNTFLKNNGVKKPVVKDRMESLNTELIDIGEGADPMATIKQLKASPVAGVVLAQPNFIYRFTQSPPTTGPDPQRNNSWHLKAIQLQDAWNVVTANPHDDAGTITIGVIDNGVNFSNTDLVNRKWSVTGCKDENGAVVTDNDDFTADDCVNGGYDVYGTTGSDHASNPAPANGDTHGTQVASVIAGKHNNGYGVIGVAQDGIEIVGIRAGESDTLRTTDVIEAIDFARQNNIKVINMSFESRIPGLTHCDQFKFIKGSQQSTPINPQKTKGLLEYEALELYGKDNTSIGYKAGLAIAAAGNNLERTGGHDGLIVIPADFSSNVSIGRTQCWAGLNSVISVGGTELTSQGEEEIWDYGAVDRVNKGTSYGDHIDIAAPASDIPVGHPGFNTWIPILNLFNQTGISGGTSAAAPQVAGVAALMLRVNPNLTPAEIKTMIRKSADEVSAFSGKNNTINLADGRRLNAYRAVVAALGGETEQLDTLPTIPSLTSNSDYLTATKPAKPANTVSTPGNQQLTISWNKVYNAERYEIRWRAEGENTTPTLWKNIGDRTDYTITGLTNGTKYAVHVRGVKGIEMGDKAIIKHSKETTPKLSPPITPRGVMSVPGNEQLTISWAPVPDAESYEIRWRVRDIVPDPWNYTNIGNVTNYTITGLTNGTAYMVHVRAKNAAGTSNHAVIGFGRDTTPMTIPPAIPTNLTSTPGSQQLAITWDPVSNADSYEIRWRVRGTIPNPWEYTNVGNTTNKVIVGLISDVEYIIHVRAKNDAGVSLHATINFGANTTPLPAVDSDGNGLIDIATLEQLNNMRYNLRGTSYKTSSTDTGVTTGCPLRGGCRGYELLNNLDFAGSQWAGGAGWEPLNEGHPGFGAEFEGNNHIISNLFINSDTDASFFGWLRSDTALVKNLTLENASVTGRGFATVGTLASSIIKFSEFLNTVVSNVTVKNSTISGESGVGGLVGGLQQGVIDNSLVTGSTIIRREEQTTAGASHRSHQGTGSIGAGGLVGNLGGTINNSSVTNSTVRGHTQYGGAIGGFVGTLGGIIENSSVINSTITNNTTSTYTTGSFATGGFIGKASGHADIENSYITGSSVIGSEGDRRTGYTGGLIGEIVFLDYGNPPIIAVSNETTVTNVYSDVSVNNIGKGVYGHKDARATLTITNSYYNREKATATPLQPGAKTLAQLQSGTPSAPIYTNWSTDIWDFGIATELPTLR